MNWTPQGPRPGVNGQSEGITDREIVGAVNAVVPHPRDPDILYIGAVNGGVWRTRNAQASRPDWISLMPDEESLSIGALCLDRGDASTKTLVAGTGRFSSMRRVGGMLLGVMRSTDGGASWSVHDNGGRFNNLHIRSIHANGDVIVLSANSNSRSPTTVDGVYRSVDAGQSFAHLSNSNLQQGRSFAVAASPVDADLIYAHAGAAIFRSTDGGANWNRVSPSSWESDLSFATNVKITLGPGSTVFVAIVARFGRSDRLSRLFRSGDGGNTWSALDLPGSVESGGSTFGIHPGGQGDIHFSLAADLEDENIVYIGGDRQPAFNERPRPGTNPRQFPNSVGARTYSGRIFRVDASRAQGRQASPITHVNSASNSAPHADSRTMAIASNGDLIEGDDGGVYRRTDPRSNSGDWESVIGSLANTEIHSGAFDVSSGVIIGGTQDNGTLQQAGPAGDRWPTVMGGDGGVVAVASMGSAGGSVRYSSWQFLGNAQRRFFDANGRFLARHFLQLREVGTNEKLKPQFYSPIQTNTAAPLRLLICGRNAVWESFDRGDTLRLVRPHGVMANTVASVAYGGTTDADILYVGGGINVERFSGQDVFVRTGGVTGRLRRATRFSTGGQPVTAMALDPDSTDTAFGTTFDSVHRTTDAGQTWANITGDLLANGGRAIRSIIWCGNIGQGHVVVGTNAGIYAAEGPDFTSWSKLGQGLPSVPVMQLQYDVPSQKLLAATLGRGAWTFDLTSSLPAALYAGNTGSKDEPAQETG